MPMNSPFLHCMWSHRKSRLSVPRACEFFSFSKGWTYLVPVGLSLDLCSSRVDYWTICGPVFDPCWTLAHFWIICGVLWTIGELLVGSLLDRIGFLGHFVIGLSIAMVGVIAVL